MSGPSDAPFPAVLDSYLHRRRLPGGRWAAVQILRPGDRGRIVAGPIDGGPSSPGSCDVNDGW